MRSENQGTMKERLILQFDKKRFKNKELLELGLELSFFLKKTFNSGMQQMAKMHFTCLLFWFINSARDHQLLMESV